MASYQPFDINKLRQQALMQGFGQIPDIMGPSTGPTFEDNAQNPNFQPPPMSPPQPAAPPVNQGQEDILSLINRAYTPETGSRDRFNSLLDNMPERNDPSIGRRIVAGGMGIGSKDPLATMEGAMFAPYMRDIEAWKTKATPFAQAAQLENTANVNERQLAGNVLTADLGNKRLIEQGRIADEKTRVNEIRAKAYAWKQMLPDYDWDTSGPTIILRGPNGEIKDTGIETGKMSQEDLQLLKNKGTLAAAQARGNTAVTTTGIRELITAQDDEGNLYTYDPQTQELKPGPGSPIEPVGQLKRISGAGAGGAGRTDTPTQAKERRQMQLRDIYERNPQYQKWFKANPNGTLELKTRPGYTWLSGDTYDEGQMAEWDAVNALVNPGYKAPNATGGGTSPAATSGGDPRAVGPTYDRPAGPPIVYKYQQNPNNPQHIRRQAANTNVWQESTDGGKTWK